MSDLITHVEPERYFVTEAEPVDGATLNDFLNLCGTCARIRRERGDKLEARFKARPSYAYCDGVDGVCASVY